MFCSLKKLTQIVFYRDTLRSLISYIQLCSLLTVVTNPTISLSLQLYTDIKRSAIHAHT